MTLVVSGYPGEVQKVEFAKMMRFAWYHHVEGLSLQPSGSSRGVEVTFTRAVAPGILVEQTLPMVVNADENLSGDPRRDRIILKHDWGTNTTTLEVKEGTPGTNPQLPSVTLDPGVLFEQTLAELFTASGQGAYTQADIQNTANPTQSPVVVVPFSQFTPLAAQKQIRIDPGTGLLRYSDGSSSNLPLQVQHQHVSDRAVLNLEGDGTDRNLGTGTERFRTTFLTQSNVGPFGSGNNTAERVMPFSGLYLVTQAARCLASGSTGEEFELRVRRNGTPGQLDGSIISRAGAIFGTAGTPEGMATQAEVIGPLSAGDRLKFTIANRTGVTITDDGNPDWKYAGLIYLGPA